jgi:ANTAR domain
MMEEWATGQVIGSLQARRELDMANGILVALRRCSPDAAFRELLGAAKRHGVGVMALASAVVDLASGDSQSPAEPGGPAHSAASHEWAGLLDGNDHCAQEDTAANERASSHPSR